jgi:fructose/tagatose bisphosphate aldolase
MPADPEAPFDDYTRSVASLVKYAHGHGVSVEAEVGVLPCGMSGAVHGNGEATDPETAERFVEATGVDLLAVSVGNVHIMIDGTQGLDLERLAEIRRRVSVPLVLHGGSGIASEPLKQAIRLGVAKVNYGTGLKQRYLSAVRAALGSGQTNPHELLGMGGAGDAMVAGRLAVRGAVLERMEFLGCCGKA